MFDFGARRPWPMYATLKYLSDTCFDTCNDIRNGISHDKDDPDGTKSSQVVAHSCSLWSKATRVHTRPRTALGPGSSRISMAWHFRRFLLPLIQNQSSKCVKKRYWENIGKRLDYSQGHEVKPCKTPRSACGSQQRLVTHAEGTALTGLTHRGLSDSGTDWDCHDMKRDVMNQRWDVISLISDQMWWLWWHDTAHDTRPERGLDVTTLSVSECQCVCVYRYSKRFGFDESIMFRYIASKQSLVPGDLSPHLSSSLGSFQARYTFCQVCFLGFRLRWSRGVPEVWVKLAPTKTFTLSCDMKTGRRFHVPAWTVEQAFLLRLFRYIPTGWIFDLPEFIVSNATTSRCCSVLAMEGNSGH